MGVISWTLEHNVSICKAHVKHVKHVQQMLDIPWFMPVGGISPSARERIFKESAAYGQHMIDVPLAYDKHTDLPQILHRREAERG